MASMKKTFKLEISMYSGASEADIYTHLAEFVEDVKRNLETLRTASWYKELNTDWEESYTVDIETNMEEIQKE
jgi:hypothetical protein